MKFNSDSLDKMRAELNVVLSKYGDEKQIQFEIGKITYSEDSFKTTLECFDTSSGEDLEKLQYLKYCERFGAVPSWYGMSSFSKVKQFLTL